MARVVYSSGPSGSSPRGTGGCPGCAAEPCRCEPVARQPPGEQRVHVQVVKAGRRGKTVTVAGPLSLGREDAARLLARLKRQCASGGALKRTRSASGQPAFALEIQGDHADHVRADLAASGYVVRGPGG